MAALLILYFAHESIKQRSIKLLFQQTYSLFLGLLLIPLAQYRNMAKDREEIHLQGKELCNS